MSNVTESHYWSDRRKLVDISLFRGYVFVQIPNSAEAKLGVLKTHVDAPPVGSASDAAVLGPATDRVVLVH